MALSSHDRIVAVEMATFSIMKKATPRFLANYFSIFCFIRHLVRLVNHCYILFFVMILTNVLVAALVRVRYGPVSKTCVSRLRSAVVLTNWDTRINTGTKVD